MMVTVISVSLYGLSVSLQSNDALIHNKNGTSDGYSFSEDNYNAGKCGSGHTLTGDIPQGNSTYDAATVNIGSPWKMPTKDQYQELINNTTNEWITINGVNGYKFISKSNSTKYIFLPAAGDWYDATHSNVGSRGRYWSTGYNDSDWAWYLRFTSSSVNMSNNNRYYGRSMVAVR